MPVLNFFCIKHIQFYHVNLLQAFLLFQFSFFQVKMVYQYEVQVIFQKLLPKKRRHTFDPLKIIYWKLLQHCPILKLQRS